MCSLAWNKHAKWPSFQSTSLWVASVSGLSHCIEKDWSVPFDVLHALLCRSIHALFVEFVLFLYSLRNNNKSTKKAWIRMAVKLLIVWMISVVRSFNIIVWPRTRFKMPCGTSDPLWLISRLNTKVHVIPSQVAIQLENGDLVDRVSPWIHYAVDPNDGTHLYVGIHWDPPQPYQWQNSKPKKTSGLRIYECHVGIASPELRVASYKEFAYNVIPRIKKLGYNCIQLMAVMEHAYYACFGYQVTNFFAAAR